MISGFEKEWKKNAWRERGKFIACTALFQFSVPSLSWFVLTGKTLKLLNSLFSFHQCESGLLQKDRNVFIITICFTHLFFNLTELRKVTGIRITMEKKKSLIEPDGRRSAKRFPECENTTSEATSCWYWEMLFSRSWGRYGGDCPCAEWLGATGYKIWACCSHW